MLVKKTKTFKFEKNLLVLYNILKKNNNINYNSFKHMLIEN